jgi:hypothetical protein
MVLLKQSVLNDFCQDFMRLQVFPVNTVREFTGKMTASLEVPYKLFCGGFMVLWGKVGWMEVWRI